MLRRQANIIVRGHKLAGNGRGFGKEGCCEDKGLTGGGPGHGHCECGLVSAHTDNQAERREWHNLHKLAVRDGAKPTEAPLPEKLAKRTQPDSESIVADLVRTHVKDGLVPEDVRYLYAAAASGVPYGVYWRYGQLVLEGLHRAGYKVVKV